MRTFAISRFRSPRSPRSPNLGSFNDLLRGTPRPVVARHIARAKSLFRKHSGDVGDMGDRFHQVAKSPAMCAA